MSMTYSQWVDYSAKLRKSGTWQLDITDLDSILKDWADDRADLKDDIFQLKLRYEKEEITA